MVENTADAEDSVSLRLYSSQNTYKKTFQIPAGNLLKVNVRDLQQNAIPDDDGHLLLDTSGVVSLIGSHNTRSKLSFDEVIHSANQGDYIGYPANPCDFVTFISLSLDASSDNQHFPIGQETDWSISGPEYSGTAGTVSSDTSLAQVSNSGSGDVVTFTPPDDGLDHPVSFSHFPEFVENCVACSFDNVAVFGFTVNIRVANTAWGPPPTKILGTCTWKNFACSSGTPTCTFTVGLVVAFGCPDYARSSILVVNGVCEFPNFTFAADGPTPCN